MKDKELMKIYMRGFNDELYGNRLNDSNILKNKLSARVYQTGRIDAIIGDDLPGWDNQSNDDILKRIKSIDKLNVPKLISKIGIIFTLTTIAVMLFAMLCDALMKYEIVNLLNEKIIEYISNVSIPVLLFGMLVWVIGLSLQEK